MTGETDTIRGILQHFAEHLPDAPAILAPGREPLNFQDLARQADYVEETLNGWGIGRGDRVAMVVPDRPEMAVAFLTVAGCTTPAPLNPEYTASEFERYLSNIRATALIVAEGSDTAARPVAEGLGLTLIELTVESRSPTDVNYLKEFTFSLNCQSVTVNVPSENVWLPLSSIAPTSNLNSSKSSPRNISKYSAGTRTLV